jgi:hypothetical protein
VLSVQGDLGAERRLVRIRDAGELLDLALEGLLVEALDVALGADLDRGLDESRSATNAIRRMLVSRSSLEKPRPLERFSRTTSPSSTSTLEPRSRSCSSTIFEIVVLPAPESPVNHSVKPLSSAISFLFV